MAVLRDHYEEVDGLLSGELPFTIANSFQAAPSRSSTRLRGDSAEEMNSSVEYIPRWIGRSSAWKAREPEGIPAHGSGDGEGNVDPEMGERTPLLSADEKEKKRDRLAKLALNGVASSPICVILAEGWDDSEHCGQCATRCRKSGRCTVLLFDLPYRISRGFRLGSAQYLHHSRHELGDRAEDGQAHGESRAQADCDAYHRTIDGAETSHELISPIVSSRQTAVRASRRSMYTTL